MLAPHSSATMMQTGTRLAAVDLGSNSFRLEIVRFDGRRFARSQYLRETVRQGGGLDAERLLSRQAMQRGWDCLARFGEQLTGFAPSQVRAVATQTLREARNRDEFLLRANQLLGFPIEVISGHEEARLIYQGVASLLPVTHERRLVVDIGGRSTELIVGRGSEPDHMQSCDLGCITWSMHHFPESRFDRAQFRLAEDAARSVLEQTLGTCAAGHGDASYGSGGTIGAIGAILRANGAPGGTITQPGLDWLLEQLLSAGNADRLHLAGLKEDRRGIIAGGISIVRALFELLQIERLTISEGGLRHGLLGSMIGAATTAPPVSRCAPARPGTGCPTPVLPDR